MKQSRQRKSRREGMTLIEIMIVVVIMALMAGAAGFAANENAKRARVENAKSQVRTLANVAEAYLMHNPGAACPSFDELREDRLLARGGSTDDPWGVPFVLVCEEGDVNVRSGGPDGQLGNEDDIAVF